ncbi:hypothetical protein SKN63_004785, partial [Salmonella enterica]|nr:hypothetical protein [Salmonella enterica]
WPHPNRNQQVATEQKPGTSESSQVTAFIGGFFLEQREWVRVYTNDLMLAGTIAFMLPDKLHHSSDFY